jgi:hypothetical protein
MILINRKRAIVALAHTVGFLGLAAVTGRPGLRPLAWNSSAPAFILPAVYGVVTSVLTWFAAAGRGAERLYFSLCATSALFGLARQVGGDPPLHFAVYVRVAMLSFAVITGAAIARSKAS